MSKHSGLHVCRWGETGEIIVFVHGSGHPDCMDSFGNQKILADKYQLLIPHRRNYGLSPKTGPSSFETEVQDIIEVIDGQMVHLAGHSYGGVVVLLVAAAIPHLIQTLIILDSGAAEVAAGDPSVDAVVKDLIPTWNLRDPEAKTRGFITALGGTPPDQFDFSAEERENIIACSMEQGFWEPHIPTEILAGTNFPKAVIADGDAHPAAKITNKILATKIDAEYIVLTGAGHFVQNHAEFNRHFLGILQSA